jgi:hypothetical protein
LQSGAVSGEPLSVTLSGLTLEVALGLTCLHSFTNGVEDGAVTWTFRGVALDAVSDVLEPLSERLAGSVTPSGKLPALQGLLTLPSLCAGAPSLAARALLAFPVVRPLAQLSFANAGQSSPSEVISGFPFLSHFHILLFFTGFLLPEEKFCLFPFYLYRSYGRGKMCTNRTSNSRNERRKVYIYYEFTLNTTRTLRGS